MEGTYMGSRPLQLFCGQNLLLTGPKATEKNILAQNLAAAFGRPVWDISLHVNMDASGLIGTDTLKTEPLCSVRGPVYRCGISRGFGVLDEINMARNEALAVLHGISGFQADHRCAGLRCGAYGRGNPVHRHHELRHAGTRGVK